MNTANLQLQGLVMAIAGINRLLIERGVLDPRLVEAALQRAESTAIASPHAAGLSAANREAIAFPIRLLEIASRESSSDLSFEQLAREVAEETPASDEAEGTRP
jgi:hypothetical protein